MPQPVNNEADLSSRTDDKRQWVEPEVWTLDAKFAENSPNPSSDFNEVGFS